MITVDKNFKTVAVVTPCRNSEKYLSEAIDSVINQKGDFYIDYVVIDCCSSDGTLEILERYKRLIDEGKDIKCKGISFRYISEPDSSMYEGLAKGFKLVEGDIACYINSDDFYLPNAFQTVVKQFDREEVNWLTGLPCLYNEDGAILPSMTPCLYKSRLIRKGVYGRYLPHIQQESTFWSFELFEAIDFSVLANFKLAGDYYLWRTFSEKCELFTLNALLSGFRMHTGNLSLQGDEYQGEFEKIVEGNLGLLDRLYILMLKMAFKLFGNNVINYAPSVLRVHK